MPNKSFTRAVIWCPTSHASFSYIYNSSKSSAHLIHVLIRHSSQNPRRNLWSLCRLLAALSYLLSLPVQMFPTNWHPSCFPNCVRHCWSLHTALQQAQPRLPFTSCSNMTCVQQPARHQPTQTGISSLWPCAQAQPLHRENALISSFYEITGGCLDKMKALLTLKTCPQLPN